MEAPLLLGDTPMMTRLREDIVNAGRTDLNVLIVGETGTGKEVVARQIHATSARRTRAFVAVNSGGIPDTLLESELFGHVRGSFTDAFLDKRGLVQRADGGTLFLQELGEMGMRMQEVLLRLTEFRGVGDEGVPRNADVRVLAATHCELHSQIAAGAFREDLFYRLNVVRLDVPPLRQRRNDILILARHFLEQAASRHGLTAPALGPDAAQELVAYAWPGNVRELRNVAEQVVVRRHSGRLTADDLPPELRDCRRDHVSRVVAAPVATRSGG